MSDELEGKHGVQSLEIGHDWRGTDDDLRSAGADGTYGTTDDFDDPASI